MADISYENQYALEHMEASAALSIAELHYLYNFCPKPDEVIERHCAEANATATVHSQHLYEWERRLSEDCFDQISSAPRGLECCLKEVAVAKLLISRVCGLDEVDYVERASRVGKSLTRSFQVFAEAPPHKVVRVLTKWKNKAEERKKGVQRSVDRLRAKERELLFGKKKENRSAFIRSHKIAQSIMGKPAVDTFMATRETTIRGVLYQYVVKQKAETLLASGGHGQTLLTVCMLSGEPVCDLCIYSKDCTLLDHVVGIFTHIKAGEELTILETGNVFNVREGFQTEANSIRSLKGNFDAPAAGEALDAATRDRFLQQIQDSVANVGDLISRMDENIAKQRGERRVFLRDFMKNHFKVQNISAKTKTLMERTISVNIGSGKVDWVINDPFHLGPCQIIAQDGINPALV